MQAVGGSANDYRQCLIALPKGIRIEGGNQEINDPDLRRRRSIRRIDEMYASHVRGANIEHDGFELAPPDVGHIRGALHGFSFIAAQGMSVDFEVLSCSLERSLRAPRFCFV